MSNIIDFDKYRRAKLLKDGISDVITNEELFAILVGVMSDESTPPSEEEVLASQDFEKYEDDNGDCRCLFCGSLVSKRGSDED